MVDWTCPTDWTGPWWDGEWEREETAKRTRRTHGRNGRVIQESEAGKREEKTMGWRSLGRGWVRSWEEPQVLREPSIHFAVLIGTSVNYLSWVYFGSDRIQLGVLMMLITGQRTGPCLAYHQGPAQAVDAVVLQSRSVFPSSSSAEKSLWASVSGSWRPMLSCLVAEGVMVPCVTAKLCPQRNHLEA